MGTWVLALAVIEATQVLSLKSHQNLVASRIWKHVISGIWSKSIARLNSCTLLHPGFIFRFGNIEDGTPKSFWNMEGTRGVSVFRSTRLHNEQVVIEVLTIITSKNQFIGILNLNCFFLPYF